MCGLAGLLAGGGAHGVPDEHALGLMIGALRARGPDGEGVHVDGPCALGHRRLAVIDVAGGRQPLLSEDGRVAAIVNGEIYNFVELRRELERAGHVFATRSDAEVVVHGYEQWGGRLVDRLDGMFALAVWDGRARTLFLARDRMGEKPLYVARTRAGIAFASELKALRHAPGVSGEIDPEALLRYLVFEHVPAPGSILRGVVKLEPGTSWTVRAGGEPELHRFWDLSFPDERRRDAGPAAHALLGELRAAVRSRMVSDVPLGVFLSGGIDSSTVAALAAEVRPDLETFSVGFDDPGFDESPHARRVAAHLHTRHHEERLSVGAMLELLPAIGGLLDEPLADSSIVPTHLLARFARRHVTVALGGDGGDELFAGYPTFQTERAAALLDRVPPRLRAAALRAGGALVGRGKLRSFLRGAAMQGGRRHQAWVGALAPAAAREIMVAPPAGDPYDVIDERLARCPSDDRWDRLMYFYAKGFLGDQVLAKVDRATMAVGLEARAPLLSPSLVDFACGLAPALRLRGLTTKVLLKRAMRGLLPDEILDRRKQGFSMPVARWLRGPLRPLLEDTLDARRLEEEGLFRPAAVRALVDAHLAGAADHRKPLWTLITFQLWRRAWRDA